VSSRATEIDTGLSDAAEGNGSHYAGSAKVTRNFIPLRVIFEGKFDFIDGEWVVADTLTRNKKAAFRKSEIQCAQPERRRIAGIHSSENETLGTPPTTCFPVVLHSFR
jgi:hypothetical protein